MPQIAFIHIGKCGGGTVKRFLQNNHQRRQFWDWYHAKHTINNAKAKYIVILLRNPIERFISAFTWRFQQIPVHLENINKYIKNTGINKKNQEHYLFKKNKLRQELSMIKYFSTPNKLAESLSSNNEKLQKKAIDAMCFIGHLSKSINSYLGGLETLQKNNKRILGVIRTENLKNDFKVVYQKICKINGVKPKNHRCDTHFRKVFHKSQDNLVDKSLSPLAIRNLRIWYAQDYKCIKYLSRQNMIAPEYLEQIKTTKYLRK